MISSNKIFLSLFFLLFIIATMLGFNGEEDNNANIYGKICPSPLLTTEFINDLAFFMDDKGNNICNIISDGFIVYSVCSMASTRPYIGFSGVVESETKAYINLASFDFDGDGEYDKSTEVVSGVITLTNEHNSLTINNLIIDSNDIGLFFEGDCLVQKAGF
ncbi:MAG: hypothetical protein ACR2NW_04900 [Thermodesulfobacteriota bacterium]